MNNEPMDISAAAAIPALEPKRLNFFERYLSIWVLLCMVVGIAAGKLFPGAVSALSKVEFGEGSQVNVPIAILIWLMIYPMMLKIDFSSLVGVTRRPNASRRLVDANLAAEVARQGLVRADVPAQVSSRHGGRSARNTRPDLRVPGGKSDVVRGVAARRADSYSGLLQFDAGLSAHAVLQSAAQRRFAWRLDWCEQLFRTRSGVAITLFGPGSGAALACVVGVLVEVPVMLSVCKVCNRSRDWYGRNTAATIPRESVG